MKVMVSVVVPCYNHSRFLDEALQSIYNQTYLNWECLIVNDGSIDNTEEVANNWVLKDRRFKYFYKSNGGSSSARNFGIKKAEGKYILPLDADDFFEKTFMEKAIQCFDRNDELSIVYSEALFFGIKNEKWELEEFSFDRMLISNMIHSAAMFKREDFDGIGGYDEDILYEDWDFWLRLLSRRGEVHRIPEPLFNYRTHEHGSQMNELEEKDERHFHSLKAIYDKNVEIFMKVYGNPIEIERKRQKLNKELNHPLYIKVKKYKKSLLGRIILKLLK